MDCGMDCKARLCRVVSTSVLGQLWRSPVGRKVMCARGTVLPCPDVSFDVKDSVALYW